jgi:hypothetical protein
MEVHGGMQNCYPIDVLWALLSLTPWDESSFLTQRARRNAHGGARRNAKMFYGQFPSPVRLARRTVPRRGSAQT